MAAMFFLPDQEEDYWYSKNIISATFDTNLSECRRVQYDQNVSDISIPIILCKKDKKQPHENKF
jgi:hypothetical protein